MTQDAAGHLVLEGDLTLRTVEAVHAKIGEVITRHANVVIDCTAAADVDLSFVQLLVAARTSARRAGGTVVLAARPDGALLDTLMRGGFRVAGQGLSRDAAGFWFEGAQA